MRGFYKDSVTNPDQEQHGSDGLHQPHRNRRSRE
jgi:hypothetical protein